MHNMHIFRFAMSKAEDLDGLATDKYGIWKDKLEDIQALNIRLFYGLTR